MSEVLKVCLIGRDGRMGRAAEAWVQETEGLELIGAVDINDDWGVLQGAGVGLDVTSAGLGLSHGERLLDMGIRPVIGTSGVTPLDAAQLDRKSKSLSLGGAVVPNFSVGFLEQPQLLGLEPACAQPIGSELGVGCVGKSTLYVVAVVQAWPQCP